MDNIIDHFNRYFEMVPATSEELKKEVYKLRYQVYCIENEFENRELYPDKLEFDEFDQNSIHYLIRHLNSNDYAATVRLILPDVNNPEKLFPLEQHCHIDNVAVMQPIIREQLGEISRFCVSKAFKKRKNEKNTLATIDYHRQDYFTPNERRTFPHLSLALMACVIKASYENDIRYLYVVTEPSWIRCISAMGINLIQIGPQVDYHGERLPNVLKITDMLDGVAEKNLDIWNLLTNQGSIWQDRPMTQYSSHKVSAQY
jgi:N-acyl amino acid synthase of PEP-CTERM/exosortase system